MMGPETDDHGDARTWADARDAADHARELAALTHSPRLRAELLRVADEMEADGKQAESPRPYAPRWGYR